MARIPTPQNIRGEPAERPVYAPGSDPIVMLAMGFIGLFCLIVGFCVGIVL